MARRVMNLADPVILVKVLGPDDGGWEPGPNTSVKCLLCGLQNDIDTDSDAQEPVVVTEGREDRTITVANFRSNYPMVGAYYLAFRFGKSYVIDNQAVFLEYMT